MDQTILIEILEISVPILSLIFLIVSNIIELKNEKKEQNKNIEKNVFLNIGLININFNKDCNSCKRKKNNLLLHIIVIVNLLIILKVGTSFFK